MISVTISTRPTSGGRKASRGRIGQRASIRLLANGFQRGIGSRCPKHGFSIFYGKPKNADNSIIRPNRVSHLHSAQHRRTCRWGSSSEGKVRKEDSSVMQNSCGAIREWVVVSARCADLYSEDSRDGRQIDLTGAGARGRGVRESDRTSTA